MAVAAPRNSVRRDRCLSVGTGIAAFMIDVFLEKNHFSFRLFQTLQTLSDSPSSPVSRPVSGRMSFKFPQLTQRHPLWRNPLINHRESNPASVTT